MKDKEIKTDDYYEDMPHKEENFLSEDAEFFNVEQEIEETINDIDKQILEYTNETISNSIENMKVYKSGLYVFGLLTGTGLTLQVLNEDRGASFATVNSLLSTVSFAACLGNIVGFINSKKEYKEYQNKKEIIFSNEFESLTLEQKFLVHGISVKYGVEVADVIESYILGGRGKYLLEHMNESENKFNSLIKRNTKVRKRWSKNEE